MTRTRRILYRGRWWDVPTNIRNAAYCKARDKGMSHDQACRIKAYNWMQHAGLGRLSS